MTAAVAEVLGRVVGLQRSGGGVPKMAVERVRVLLTGMEGDWQRDRRFHGGPDRALCLYSMELIDALMAEGHPIAPGTVGENVTIAGIDWRTMQPGARLTIGTASVELTDFAAPCRTIRESFVDERFKRISEKLYPGWSRVYARVTKEGEIGVGDAVRVIPSS
ncbi:MAG TPA: MOSC domain-containing protein [Opitutaceae bacterium]|nr:MOSC domain-containing protein [Opitutaceae bacterium]